MRRLQPQQSGSRTLHGPVRHCSTLCRAEVAGQKRVPQSERGLRLVGTTATVAAATTALTTLAAALAAAALTATLAATLVAVTLAATLAAALATTPLATTVPAGRCASSATACSASASAVASAIAALGLRWVSSKWLGIPSEDFRRNVFDIWQFLGQQMRRWRYQR